MYDAQLGRFHSIDPLTEWHFKYTPYHYCFNNPIWYVDLFGLDTADYVTDDGIPGFVIDKVVIVGEKSDDDDDDDDEETQPYGENMFGDGNWTPRTKAKHRGKSAIEVGDDRIGHWSKMISWFRNLFKRKKKDDNKEDNNETPDSEINKDNETDKDGNKLPAKPIILDIDTIYGHLGSLLQGVEDIIKT